jgi:hypothetical protein
MIILDIETTGLTYGVDKMTCAVTFDTTFLQFTLWNEHQLDALIDTLKGQMVGGWNVFGFDLPFLEADANRDIEGVVVCDPFIMAERINGKRTSLQTVLKALFPDDEMLRKSEHGSNAPKLYAEGMHEELRAYCALDVYLETIVMAEALGAGLPLAKGVGQMTEGDMRRWVSPKRPPKMVEQPKPAVVVQVTTEDIELPEQVGWTNATPTPEAIKARMTEVLPDLKGAIVDYTSSSGRSVRYLTDIKVEDDSIKATITKGPRQGEQFVGRYDRFNGIIPIYVEA